MQNELLKNGDFKKIVSLLEKLLVPKKENYCSVSVKKKKKKAVKASNPKCRLYPTIFL